MTKRTTEDKGCRKHSKIGGAGCQSDPSTARGERLREACVLSGGLSTDSRKFPLTSGFLSTLQVQLQIYS
jgi:hypothetical protein